MESTVIKHDVYNNFIPDIRLTLFVYSTTHPLSDEDAKEDPNGTKSRKAGYLQE